MVNCDGKMGSGGGGSSILTDGFRRQCWFGPFRDQQDLSVEDVLDVGIEQGCSITISGLRGRTVWITQGVCRLEIISTMGKIDGAITLALVVFLDVECYDLSRCSQHKKVSIRATGRQRTGKIFIDHFAGTTIVGVSSETNGINQSQ